MGFNAKLFDVLIYPDSFDVTKLDSILDNSAIKDYAYITHDKDDKKTHLHVAIRTIDTRNSEYVARWFNIPENLVGRVKGRWSDILKYLTHANASEKHQYDKDEVTSNFDWQKTIEEGSLNKRIDEIIENIASGNIREYNYTNYITDKEYIKYKKQIDTAFSYRKDKIKGAKREMENVYICGEAGFGKTTYAKMICEEKGYSYYISSGSNDVLDGYMGEDVLILDDLRPSCMSLSDMLKMLDNHTNSLVKSRYKNKMLECKMIIITSIFPIDIFFNGVFSEEKEPIVQLKRRCKTYIEMRQDFMDIYLYDEEIRDYESPVTARNPVANFVKSKRTTREERIDRMKKLLVNVEIDETTREMQLVEENVEIVNIFGEKRTLK